MPACSALRRWRDAEDDALIAHCEAVAARIPSSASICSRRSGGRPLVVRVLAPVRGDTRAWSRSRSRRSTGIRRWTCVRAVVDAGRDDIALYTGNDDTIVADLVTPFRFAVDGRQIERRIVGGLLGHWAVWTQGAVPLLAECHAAVRAGQVPAALLQRGVEVTDANAAFFDAANGFAGCIAGIQEVLRRQGLVRSARCLDAPTKASAPARRRKSIVSVARTLISRTMRSFGRIWTSGSDAETLAIAGRHCGVGRRPCTAADLRQRLTSSS